MTPSLRAGWGAALGIAVLLAVAGPVPAAPAEAGKPAPQPTSQEELRRLQRRLVDEKERLQQARRRERRIADDVQRLDRQREATESELRRLGRDMTRIRKRAEVASAELARTEAKLARHRTMLGVRLLDAYRYGRAGYLDVVLGATSFPEFISRARLVGVIVREDSRLIGAYQADRDRVARLRVDLENEQARLRAVARETEERQQALERQVAAKREVLRRVALERHAGEQAVRELEEDSAALEALIRSATPSSALRPSSAGGAVVAMRWPLGGNLTSRFGYRRHPLFRRVMFHTGVDIAAPRGTPVPAAAGGRVIFAGWYGGYGKLVILDHGGGTSSLYGHLSTISVSVGQAVTAGQVIGRVGSTGYSTGPHLHYEVRINGRPVNPQR